MPFLPQSKIETAEHLFDNWFDPIETGLRDRAREFLQAMFEAELDEALGRSRYARCGKRSSDDCKETWALAVIATATGRARCWERSGGWRSRCRAPG
jgi:hypothetical protein